MKNVNLVSTVTSVLFVANSTLAQLLLIKSPLETSTFTCPKHTVLNYMKS